ncbi:MAG: YibE/F family protein, partial [Propionibacterium sp.]|nr:YibE/F family protein [Propionibacterium sp.]
MGHSHSHGDVHVEVGARTKQVLVGFLVALAVVTVAGLIWLWPSQGEINAGIQRVETPAGVISTEATITAVEESCEGQFEPAVGELQCLVFTVDVHGGPDAGSSVEVQVTGPPAQAGLQVGDEIDITRIDTADGPLYSYKGINRTPVLVVLGLLFVVAVVAVARWKGLFAILGLVFAGAVLIRFIIPGILLGKPGMAVALVGSTAIMYVV